MLTCTIDTNEGRHVTVTDIPRAFVHANMNKDVQIILEAQIEKLIVKNRAKTVQKICVEK